MASGRNDEAVQAMVKSLESLKIDSKYSDLTLKCKGHEFHVHRCIVFPQSPVIEATCNGAFEVCFFSEKRVLKN